MLECILTHLKARQIIRVIDRLHKLGYYDEIRIPVPYLDKDKLVKVMTKKERESKLES